MRYLAIYKSSNGEEFSAPLTVHSGQWMLHTAFGLRSFDYSMQETGSPSGFIEFFELRLEAPAGLRACDFVALDTEMRRKVRVPKKPVEQPVQKVNAESDSVPNFPRINGETDRAYLQRIAAETDAFDRRVRTEERREIISQSSPNRKRVAEAVAAKTLGEEDLRLRRPRGRGGYVEVERQN
jgi:hypothetical protein